MFVPATKFNMHVAMWSPDQTGMRVVENSKSCSCLAWNSPALSVIGDHSRYTVQSSSVYWKTVELEACPIVRYHWLLSVFVYLSTFAESNTLEFCLDTIRIHGVIRNDFRTFTENFQGCSDDLRMLLKMSKGYWRFQRQPRCVGTQ